MSDGPRPWISVAIPVRDERPGLEALLAELEPVLASLGRPWEVIFVDDGSRDGTGELLASLASSRPQVSVISFPENRGKSAAWSAAFKAARGELVCTMDADLQNDPADIPRLVAKLGEGYDGVSGRRRRRETAFWTRILPSLLGNLLIRALTANRLRDHGCGLKLFRRDAVAGLELARGMHRYVSVLVELDGGRVTELEVNDRRRVHGRSKYGPERIVQVPVDLARLMFAGGRAGAARPHPPDAIAIGILALLGLALRLHKLGSEGYWSDEMLTLLHASPPIAEIPGALADRSVHPPLYFMLLHPWIALGGTSEAWLRLPSAIFGSLSIPALALLGSRMFDRRTGFLAGLLLALSPFHLHYSQEARPYALLGLLSLLSLMAYERMRRAPDRRSIAAYVAAGVALAYTHVFGLVVLAVLNLHWLACRIPRAGRAASPSLPTWIAAQLAIAASLLPWMMSLQRQVAATQRYEWIKSPTWASIPETFLAFAGDNVPLAIATGVCVLLGILVALGRRATPGWKLRFGAALYWTLAPVAASLLVSILVRPVHHPRYVIAAAPMLALAAAAGLAAAVPGRLPGLAATLVLAALAARPIQAMRAEPQREQWREAAAFVDRWSLPSDRLVTWGESLGNTLAYERYAARPLPHVTLREARERRADMIDPGGRIWLLLAQVDDTVDELRRRDFPGYAIVRSSRLKGVEAVLLER